MSLLCFIVCSTYILVSAQGQKHDCSDPSQHPSCRLLPSWEECGPVGLDTRIVGGINAFLGQFPWLVIIRERDTIEQCGGAIITTRYILTAAHCVEPYQLDKTKALPYVTAGEHDLSTSPDCVNEHCAPPEQEIDVESTVMHKDFDKHGNTENDIGLMRLVKDVQFNDYVKPICLPLLKRFSNSSYVGKQFQVAGWGIYKEEGFVRTTPNILQTVELPVQSLSKCQRKYLTEISSDMLCAGGTKGQDSCDGDSGGPLTGIFNDDSKRLRNFVMGVVSFGADVCSANAIPSIYTNIAHYTDWILDSMVP